jgi:hypothetical protein
MVNGSILIFFVFGMILLDRKLPFDTDEIIMKRRLKQFGGAVVVDLIV